MVPIPGASAITSAIAVSGLPITEFVYLGFLPRRGVERRRLLESLAAEGRALLALETPHRLLAALGDIRDTLGDRRIAVCRELTKLHEEVFRASVSEAIAHFGEPRGEFTLVIEGFVGGLKEPPIQEAEARALLARLRADGARAKESVAQVAEASGLSKRALYRLWLDTKGRTTGDAEDPR